MHLKGKHAKGVDVGRWTKSLVHVSLVFGEQLGSHICSASSNKFCAILLVSYDFGAAKVTQSSIAKIVYNNIFLRRSILSSRHEGPARFLGAYRLKIAMDNAIRVEIQQAFCYVFDLGRYNKDLIAN
jgi:hypothetical protein